MKPKWSSVFKDKELFPQGTRFHQLEEADIHKAFENTSFGDVNKRYIINRALVEVQMGFAIGGTIREILCELKLLTPKKCKISAKGLSYLRGIYGYFIQVPRPHQCATINLYKNEQCPEKGVYREIYENYYCDRCYKTSLQMLGSKE
jgi:hypothetical protein